jgi:hypothetical protein
MITTFTPSATSPSRRHPLVRALFAVSLLLGLCSNWSFAQATPPPLPDPAKLAVSNEALPPITVHQPYRYQFKATGGIPPMKWDFRGDLPAGIDFGRDGVLSGTPDLTGEWHLTVAVTDSSRPPQTATRELGLVSAAALQLEWKVYPHVANNRIVGSAAVSNGTKDDFDFTFLAVAVNEIGKAFALGYQHFPLKQGALEFEIPFGQNLPRGTYFVNVDGVGEVAVKKAIFRGRLETKEKLAVNVGP